MSLSLNKHAVLGTLTFDQVDENWEDIQTLVNQINSRLPQNNWQATTNPTTSNDQTQGFVAGSRWYNKTPPGDLFICTSAATGAAVWVAETTLTFADVTLDAVTTSGNSTTNAVDVGALRSTNWVGTVANGALGHVVESGSNANGEYMKLANGWMICTHTIDSSSVDIATASGSMYVSAGQVWTFPASFSSAPLSSGSVERSASIAYGIHIRGTTTSAANYNIWGSVSGALPKTTRIFAIGRWF